ncbi:MAG: 23S rRNA (uracil1939-C5)-methyltransferase [Alphaproteobacteria bacterium]|jgi:23S rRNA (uracil1939-C5)-methyltransferase
MAHDINREQCSAYELCGGCSYQHLSGSDYKALKINYFNNAFASLQLNDACYQTPIFIPHHTRRRTAISFYNDGKNYVWGYKQAKSHKIIAAPDCVVVTPLIEKTMPILAELIEPLVKQDIQVKAYITEAHNGLDIHLKGLKAPKPKALSHFNEVFFKAIPKAIRLSIDDDIIGQTHMPLIDIAGFQMPLPHDVFLQPSQQGQNILIEKVMAGLGKTNKKTKIIDLFCGLGTFTLPISQQCYVAGYDNAGNAIDALIDIKKHENLDHRLDVFKRDLFRDPVSFMELKQFDIAVIDPPRAGAQAQMEQMAKSSLKKIIYVFCDTQTAARDLKILTQNGFTIKSLTAIDQFVDSQHIEGIAIICK